MPDCYHCPPLRRHGASTLGRIENPQRFRTPSTLIDSLVLALGALAVGAGLVALVGSSFRFDRASALRRHSYGHELHDWHLAAILIVFAGLVVSSFAVARLVRQVASLLALGLALAALVAFWWTEIDELLGQSYLATGHVTLGAGTILGGVALGLQVVVGVLMFTAAFPLSAYAPARGTT